VGLNEGREKAQFACAGRAWHEGVFMFDAKAVTRRIIEWIAEFFEKNGTPGTKAVIGISGGKDSSVVAALCVKALGKDRVLGVLMPQGEQEDINTAYELCRTLDIQYAEVNIDAPMRALRGGIAAAGLEFNDIAAINTPSRLRMAALYAVNAVAGGRVANTGNLSEDYVGYSTKYGVGAAGDFSPLSQLTVSEVKAVGRELGLAPAFIDKTPLDGLSGKTDEENLGFTYEVLDRYIREGVSEDSAVKEKIDRLHRLNRHKTEPMPVFRLRPEGEICG
jgi:NAD+ synthase